MDKIELLAIESEKAYNSEIKRMDRLTDRADKFIAAVAVVAGFQLTQVENLDFTGDWMAQLPDWLTLLSLAVLGIAILFAMASMNLRKYYSYPLGETLLDELKGDDVDDDSARVKVARMYLKWHDTNSKANDVRAQYLTISGILLIVGFGLATVSFLLFKLS